MLLEHIVESGQEDDEVRQADSRAVLDVGVGEETALPVSRVSVLPTFLRGGLNQVAKLTTAADEEYDATTICYVGCEVQGQLKMLHSLVEINDVLAQAGAVEVGLHEPEINRQQTALIKNLQRKEMQNKCLFMHLL